MDCTQLSLIIVTVMLLYYRLVTDQCLVVIILW